MLHEPKSLMSVSNALEADVTDKNATCRIQKAKGLPLRRRSAGFTLVEVLVVLVIIGMVMGLVGPRVLGYLADSKVKTARIQIENIASAVDLFYLDNGRYPEASEGLAALVDRPNDLTAWNGPYLKSGAVPVDPWGKPYIYRMPGPRGPFEILSSGIPGPDLASNQTVSPGSAVH